MHFYSGTETGSTTVRPVDFLVVSMIVTHNVRDFDGVEEQFGIRIATPGVLLMEMEGLA